MGKQPMAKGNTKGRGSAPQPAAKAGLRDRPGMVRFLCLFPVWVVLGFGLLRTPVSRPLVDRFTAVLVEVSAFAVRLFGGQAIAQGSILRNPGSGLAVSVEDTCNASNVMVLLFAAVLAFPARRRQKAKGLVVGSVVLHTVNLFRIISLFYLRQYDSAWFEFAHLYVWEGLMMVLTLVLFWVWVQDSRESPASRAQ